MDDRLAEFVAKQHDRVCGAFQERAGPCPDDNDWALLADDLLSGPQRDALLEHVGRCPRCRRSANWIMAEPKRRRWLRLILYAAAACLVAGTGIHLSSMRFGLYDTRLLAQADRQVASGQYLEARRTLDRLGPRRHLGAQDQARVQGLWHKSYVGDAKVKLDKGQYAEAAKELDEAMRRGYASAEIKRLRGHAMMGTALAVAASDERLTRLGLAGITVRHTKDVHRPTTPEAVSQAALALLRESAEAEPASPMAWRELGMGLMADCRFSDAAEALDRWAQLEPKNAAAHNAEGLALYAGGQYAKAPAAFKRAIALAPNVAAYELNAAIASEESGGLPEAVGHWKRYLALEPGGADADEARTWLAVLEQGMKQ